MRLSWSSATWRSLIIFGYVVIFTVWLPDRVVKIGAVASASTWIRDGIALVAWGVPLLVALVGVRIAQEHELI